MMQSRATLSDASWRSDPQLPAGFLVGADDSTSADLRRLFDHAHDALFLVDRSGAVACCNINAANLVSAGYVLTKTIDARLKFLDFETARKYQSALNGVFVQKTTFDVFQVCSSCHPTFQISVHCAQKSFGQDYAIVTARNVAETLSLRARLAESHFSLTPCEGRVLEGMLNGFTPQELADVTDLKITTIRSQLSSIFAKTSTKRQAELICLILNLPLI